MQILEEERDSLIRRIYNINEQDFESVVMDVWLYQYLFNPVYQAYCKLVRKTEGNVSRWTDIPFLPISMFKEHQVQTGSWVPEIVFYSSGTTGQEPSQHLIRDKHWYNLVARKCFSEQWGELNEFTWLALLPSYLERGHSSLVHMVQDFMNCSQHPSNAFYPTIDVSLIKQLELLSKTNEPTILWGVSFALLDFCENYEWPSWSNLILIETGGMKGRRDEITREELHSRMRTKHPELQIGSEYGMTELLSQAYLRSGVFQPGSTMKVMVRDINDPFKILPPGQRGLINVIDLANLDTCSFIATEDIGFVYPEGQFDVLGRLDSSELRGCNLLYQAD